MSFNAIKRIRSGLIWINPYFNDKGRFEFSRVVATFILIIITTVLWVFRDWLINLSNEPTVYGYTAQFYYLALLKPFLCLPDIHSELSALLAGSHPYLKKLFPIVGTLTIAFAFASLYMVLYSIFIALRHGYFRIGDYLGVWVVPLFVSGLYFFLTMAWAELQMFLA